MKAAITCCRFAFGSRIIVLSIDSGTKLGRSFLFVSRWAKHIPLGTLLTHYRWPLVHILVNRLARIIIDWHWLRFSIFRSLCIMNRSVAVTIILILIAHNTFTWQRITAILLLSLPAFVGACRIMQFFLTVLKVEKRALIQDLIFFFIQRCAHLAFARLLEQLLSLWFGLRWWVLAVKAGQNFIRLAIFSFSLLRWGRGGRLAQAIEQVDQDKLYKEKQDGARCEWNVDFILRFCIVFIPHRVENVVDHHTC